MKKGSYILGMEILQAIPKLFLVSLTLIVFMAALGYYYFIDVDVRDIESMSLAARFFYSKNCAAYDDGIRIYPGIIDLNKFDEKTLLNCYDLSSNKVGMVFELFDNENKLIKNVKISSIAPELCDIKNKNFYCYKRSQGVLYFDGDLKKTGMANVMVIINDK